MPMIVLLAAILLAPAVLAESRLIDKSDVSTNDRTLMVAVSGEGKGRRAPLDGALIFGCRSGLFVQVELYSKVWALSRGARTSVTLLFDDQPEIELQWLRRGRDDVVFSFDGDQWLDRSRKARRLTAKLVDANMWWEFDLRSARRDLRRFERRCRAWGRQSEEAGGDMSPELVLALALARPSDADLPRVMDGRDDFSDFLFMVLLNGASASTLFCKSLGGDEEAGLLYAASNGDMEGVRREVTARERTGVGVGGDDEKWRTQVKLAQSTAACNGHVEIVRFLDAAKADSLALLGAVYEGHTDVVDELLAAGADADDDLSGVSLLQIAALRGHAEVVRALLAAGADPRTEYKGETALNMAIRRSDLLLIGASMDPAKHGGGGLTALADTIEMLRAAMAGGD